MSRRFGRNQRRQLREQLDLAHQVAQHAQATAHQRLLDVEREKKRFQEFASQCRMVDGRGYEITIRVEAMENLHQRHVEFFAELNNRGRERLAVMERIDPRTLTLDRDNFEIVVSGHMAAEFARFIDKKGWR